LHPDRLAADGIDAVVDFNAHGAVGFARQVDRLGQFQRLVLLPGKFGVTLLLVEQGLLRTKADAGARAGGAGRVHDAAVAGQLEEEQALAAVGQLRRHRATIAGDCSEANGGALRRLAHAGTLIQGGRAFCAVPSEDWRKGAYGKRSREKDFHAARRPTFSRGAAEPRPGQGTAIRPAEAQAR
jgi:hypothetical protein